MKKLRIGWYSFTCCEDSTILFTELLNTYWDSWSKFLTFVDARVLRTKGEMKDLDIAFVEGAIAGKEQVGKLKKIRKNAQKVVAIGACAATGMPAGWRNTFTPEQKKQIQFLVDRFSHLDKVEPISSYVKVDAVIPGCPMDEKQFIKLIDECISDLKKRL